MKRYLQEPLLRDLGRKMVLLSGPRQVGKTFLAREAMKAFSRPQYLNYDNLDDARIVQSRTWAADADFLVLDEIHKMRDWKSFLKGTVDTRTKVKKEVDFALVEKGVVTTLIEVKLSEAVPAPGLKYLARKIPGASAFQLVQKLRQPQTVDAIHIVEAAGWLASLSA